MPTANYGKGVQVAIAVRMREGTTQLPTFAGNPRWSLLAARLGGVPLSLLHTPSQLELEVESKCVEDDEEKKLVSNSEPKRKGPVQDNR